MKWQGGEFKCKRCGSNDRRDQVRGLCRKCYQVDYKRKHAKRLKEQQRICGRRWYARNKARHRAKTLARRTGGNWLLAMERARHRCENCGSQRLDRLCVCKKRGDSCDMANLVVLCRKCVTPVLRRTGWSDDPGAHAACASCGRIDRAHVAHGLCTACYARARLNRRLLVHAVRACDIGAAALAKFWSHVDKLSSAPCWIWTASTTYFGYGMASFGKRRALAHRVSYAVANEEAKKDELVLHSCDNPECVNPAHLRIGSSEDNMLDAALKGRLSTRLAPDAIREMRSAYDCGAGISELAGRFDVSISTAIRVVKHRTWKHIP